MATAAMLLLGMFDGPIERAKAFRDELVNYLADGEQPQFNPRAYSASRQSLFDDAKLDSAVPRSVGESPTPESFWGYMRAAAATEGERRTRLDREFAALIDHLEALSAAPAEPTAISNPTEGLEPTPSLIPAGLTGQEIMIDANSPAAQSSSWTGRRSVGEQARIVLKCGPAALQGLEALIADEHQRLHNGGPPLDSDALEDLRALHGELSTLLRLAGAGKPFGASMIALRGLVGSASRFLAEIRGELADSSAAYGTASITTLGTYLALHLVAGIPPEASAGIGATIIAVTAEAKKRRKRRA